MGDVEEERYSTPYVVKNALGATVVNNKKLIVQIERKAKGLTSAFIRISRFLNLFVLRCLENTKYIPRLNNSCIQYVCNAVFELNIQNMLIFTLEARLKKQLRLRIAEMMEKVNSMEKNKVIGFITKKLTYSKNVIPFQKEPRETLMQVIPVLIKQKQALAEVNKLTETSVKANTSRMLKFYWHIQKLFISKGQRSFALVLLSHLKCKKSEFGMSNLQDIKLGFSNLRIAYKSIHVSSIRTDGVQSSVVLSNKLEGICKRYNAEKEVQKRFKSKEQKDKKRGKGNRDQLTLTTIILLVLILVF